MRRNDHWMLRLLLCVLLVSSLCFSAVAAEGSLLSLRAPQRVLAGEGFAVSVTAEQADVVGDGKIVVYYDAEMLTYVNAQVGSAWGESEVVLSDNGTGEGRAVLSFAAETDAAAGQILVLNFVAKGCGETTVEVSDSESYVSGFRGDLDAQVGLVVAGFDHNCTGGDTCPSKDFADVNYRGDYHRGIDYMVAGGYMKGTSDTAFSPEMKMNRAMMITVLYRVAGSPETEGTVPFTDVSKKAYYYDALVWAVQNGIAKGMTTTTFGPTVELSREQSVTFLYRFASYMGLDTSARADLSGYTDAGEVSNFANTAMQWAVGEGIVKGMSADTLVPEYVAPRVQVCVMFWRMLTN